MNLKFYKLCELICEKNDLNKIRIRCYRRYRRAEKLINDHVTYTTAKAEYRKLQGQMKAMTPAMRKLNKECKSVTRWDDCGYIKALVVNGARYSRSDIDALLAERILLST